MFFLSHQKEPKNGAQTAGIGCRVLSHRLSRYLIGARLKAQYKAKGNSCLQASLHSHSLPLFFSPLTWLLTPIKHHFSNKVSPAHLLCNSPPKLLKFPIFFLGSLGKLDNLGRKVMRTLWDSALPIVGLWERI